ncbi:copper resistance CopC/CopD family protein [Nocardioides marinquilinus]|uniref:Copper resistance CopC/CopD family protein n=1 Tax=Nocardioides marinquilinus TaxID=1210400 RepID=A0ABP9PZ95_9ACTN
MRRALAVLVAAVACAVAALAAVVGTAAPASAHATLISSDPAEGDVLPETPDVVTFTFDEPVALTGESVQVFDAAGDPVEAESKASDEVVTTDLPDELDDGSYVVVWRAISADGHPIAGSLTFAIGAPSAEVAAPQAAEAEQGDVRAVLSVVHGIGYAGLLLAGGLVLFWVWAVRDVRVDDPVRARVQRVAWTAAGVAVLAGVVGIPLAGAYQQGLPLTSLGESAAVDLALVGDDLVVLGLQVAGLLVALLTMLRRPPVAAAGATVAVLSPAIVGHSRAIEPVWLVTTTDVVHLAAGATWFGGLVGLLLVLRPLAGRSGDAARVLARFSAVAAATVALLAVTGGLMGWRILGGWAPLVDTGYGRLLLVKVGVALLVVAAAGWNRFRLLPTATAERGGHAERRRGVLAVRTAVRVEAVMLVGLLGLTGFLTNTSPRAEAAAASVPEPSGVEVGVLGEGTGAGAADGQPTGTKALVTMAPGTRGPNTISVQVQDDQGEPVDGFAAPTVSVSAVGGEGTDLGALPVVPTGAGTYAADVTIPAPGTWQVQVSVRRSEFDNPVTVVTFEVS